MEIQPKKPESPSASSQTPQSEASTLKSKTRMKIEETEIRNLEQERQTIEDIDQLASDLLSAAEAISRKSETYALKRNAVELEAAIRTLREASILSAQAPAVTMAPAQVVKPDPTQTRTDCGCGETKKQSCCIEIYGAAIRVLEAGDIIGNSLELIVAVGAGGVKAVFPSLVSYIKVNKNSGWVNVDWPVIRMCVPCDETIDVPLTVEAMDLDAALSVPETGTTSGYSITLNCNCNICPKIVPVSLSAGSIIPGEKKGKIEVEVRARRVNGECCC